MLHIIKMFFSFNGRLNRAKYLLFRIIIFICFIITILLYWYGGFDFFSIFLKILFMITVPISSLSIDVRRFHDLDKSGWLSLLKLIPLVSLIVGIYLFFSPGTDGTNEYGQDPLTISL